MGAAANATALGHVAMLLRLLQLRALVIASAVQMPLVRGNVVNVGRVQEPSMIFACTSYLDS